MALHGHVLGPEGQPEHTGAGSRHCPAVVSDDAIAVPVVGEAVYPVGHAALSGRGPGTGKAPERGRVVGRLTTVGGVVAQQHDTAEVGGAVVDDRCPAFSRGRPAGHHAGPVGGSRGRRRPFDQGGRAHYRHRRRPQGLAQRPPPRNKAPVGRGLRASRGRPTRPGEQVPPQFGIVLGQLGVRLAQLVQLCRELIDFVHSDLPGKGPRCSSSNHWTAHPSRTERSLRHGRCRSARGKEPSGRGP